MFFRQTGRSITGRHENETLVIEAWGKNALRVRCTQYPKLSEHDWALSYVEPGQVGISIEGGAASITNGKIRAVVNHAGVISFYKGDSLILREYHRAWGTESRESSCLGFVARDFDPIIGGDYRLNVRFEGRDDEKIYGMGQYQQPFLNLKGCTLEMAQRNSQVTVPFALSNLGYGFLWNNPAVGRVTFGLNYTEWHADVTDQMDYWITADDSPRQIIENYTEVTGRPPMMPDDVLGLWQCKLRYRTQDEVLAVAREYKRLNIPLDVIVIDFFHWVRQGDWAFDPEYWPDPKAMVDELHAMGTKVMVSVWPTVDRKSSNFGLMRERGLLLRADNGTGQINNFAGDTCALDPTNPEARAFIFEKCRENYLKYGIDMFWLDAAEPEMARYDFDNFRCYLGPMVKMGNLYPVMFTRAFYEGLRGEGRDDIVNLVRSAWVGSQKYGALVWSGDIPSTYEAFRDQLAAGLNMGIAGIPWWISDTGGFSGGDIRNPAFIQLLIRWFQFAAFCPVLRMHGDRNPHDAPPLSHKDYGGGFCGTGAPNELWSYGEEAFKIFKKYLDLRLKLKPYIRKLMAEAHEHGAPILRAMFYEFPQDARCWDIKDQYMFGPKYLVAPVMEPDAFSRQVYLPVGTWKNIEDGRVYEGGRTIECDAPIETMPVFERLG